jgi:hypothetical protein
MRECRDATLIAEQNSLLILWFLVQQHSFPREWQLERGIRHNVHPTFPD